MAVSVTTDKITFYGYVAFTSGAPPPYRGCFYDFKGLIHMCEHEHQQIEDADACGERLLLAFARKHRSWAKRYRKTGRI